MPTPNLPLPATLAAAVAVVVIVITLALSLACGLGDADANAHADRDPSRPAMPINRIAYINADSQLVTVNPDGADRNTLTTGAVADAGGRMGGILAQPVPAAETRLYGWPVWSPDGSRIAVSLISGSSPADAEMSVQLLESSTGIGGAAFVNAAPLTIADGTPHYVQWSPDGRLLGITAATPEGLSLFVVDANPLDDTDLASDRMPVVRGGPLYFEWSPDSNAVAVHSGQELMVLRLNDAKTQFSLLPIGRSRSFRTPAWSPDSTRLAWSAPGGDAEALWVGRPAVGFQPLRLVEVEGDCAFRWSSDGQTIAVADRQAEGSPAYRRLRLVAADGSAERTVREDDWVLGFFWEPDGSRLAWVALNPEERTMEWRIVRDDGVADVHADQPVAGLRFAPSGETFLMLAFFDQYARSHSPWAPDGSALVIAGNQQYLAERRNGSGAPGPRVYVTHLRDGGELRDIAPGGIAVWSPR